MISNTEILSDEEDRIGWVMLGFVILLGAVLRFWGLDNIGLHGDEETMALPVLSILETGSPILPSGMFYPRALSQLYMMAASVDVFGVSEWALRLPSVLAGIFMILVAYWLGRRFLPSRWSIVFALVIALLPSMIALSQTARMYVFYVTFVMLFCVALFRWERTESLGSLVVAFIVYLVALQFHNLAVFVSLLFFYPGLIKRSWRLLVYGGVAFIVSGAAYYGMSEWIESHYIVAATIDSDESVDGSSLSFVGTIHPLIASALIVVGSAVWFLIIRASRPTLHDPVIMGALAGFLISVIAAALLHYHIAGIAFMVGAALYLYSGGRFYWPMTLALVLLMGFIAQWIELSQSGDLEGSRRILIAMLGQPHPAPYLQLASFFPISFAVYAIAFAYFAIRLAQREPLPDHVVFFLISVWAPLFVISLLSSYAQARYFTGFVPLFILASIAGFRALVIQHAQWLQQRAVVAASAIFVLLITFINPVDFWHNVNPQYSDFPYLTDHRGADHKGAAEFIKSLTLGPTDILIAEDVYQQTFYLGQGKIDYRLRAFKAGAVFAKKSRYYDLYTATNVLGSAALLAEILERDDRGAIYIIGSGETTWTPEYFLGEDILALLRRYEPEIIYTGRDGRTKVTRISAPDTRPNPTRKNTIR